MTTKVQTANIFDNLQDDSDDEVKVVKSAPKTTTTAATTAAKAPAATVAVEAGSRPTRGQGRGERREGADKPKDATYRPMYNKDEKKTNDAEPRSSDRKSGAEKRPRREGREGGERRNGRNQDDAVVNKEEPTQAVVEEVPAVVEPEEPEVKDNSITVEEYFQQLGVSKDLPVEPVVERKLNLDELKREKLEVVASRSDRVLDATAVKKSAKAQAKKNPTYLLGCNTDQSELLGVKTGQTLVKFVVKMEGQELVGEEKRPAVTATQAPRGDRANFNNNKQPRNQKKFSEIKSDFPELI